jgi:flagellar basal body rod protein FlgB
MNVPFLQDTTFTGLISTKSYGTSQEWSQAYSLIQTNSALWSNDTKSLWGSISGTLSAQSDLWSYLLAETDSQTLSYTPSSYLFSISNGNTVNLSSINTTFANNSGKYESVYTNVQTNSGIYATTSYVNGNFLSLSGGLVQGPVQINNNLTVFGNLTASGTTTFANTVFTTTSSLSVVHLGSGPALYVGNFGDDHIATFVDLQNNLEMLHIGGLSSSFPNVGVKTGYPNKDFTVRGEISASGTIYDNAGNSIQWNEAYNIGTAYQSISSTFLTAETDSQTLTFTQSSVQLSITNGNTVSLSALDDKEFATAMAIALS